MVGSEELLVDLLRLRRGRGLREPRLAEHLGPHWRSLCGVLLSESDGPARAKAEALLAGFAADLAPDLRKAAELALACGNGAASRLSGRTEELAAALHCSERTARRRMDEALALVAEAAAREADPVPSGPSWRVRRFSSLLRLDTPTPELYETRTISAEQPVDVLEITLDVPERPDDTGAGGPLIVEAIHGVRVRSVEASPDNCHYRVTLALARSLQPGERLDFTLHYTLPEGGRIRDHCVLVPLHPCDSARVRVRFGVPPEGVWRVEAVAPRQLDPVTVTPGPGPLTLDLAGEVQAVFHSLRQGYAYGIAWRPTGVR